METNFDTKHYLELVSSDLRKRAEATEGKLYIEIDGKLLKDDFAARVLEGYDPEFKRKLISLFKQEAELLVCINAQCIIENTPMTKKQIPCQEYLDLLLKRMMTATGIKPQIVITNVNLEEMYDLIFSFEKRFQKKGYKVWEHYLKIGFPTNKRYLLGDNGFANDDHIPIMKKMVFVTGVGPASGKFASCIGQVYRDYTIGLKSSFCIFQTFPLAELPPTHPLHQLLLKRRPDMQLLQDETGKTIDRDLQERFSSIKNLLSSELDQENLIQTYHQASDMLICPTGAGIRDFALLDSKVGSEEN